jgi:hypothetical protein
LPVDCLRLLPPSQDGAFEGRAVAYAQEGRTVLSDTSAPVRVRYVARIEDPAEYDALFTQALAQMLAAKAAHWITHKASYADRLMQLARETLLNAQLIDALETYPERAEDEAWIDGRFTGVVD